MSARQPSSLGTYLDVKADAFISGQNLRGLVIAFFEHPERIEISGIHVSREGDPGEGMGWQDGACEAEDSIHRGRFAEPMGASEYHYHSAVDFTERAITRRRGGLAR